MPEFIINIAPLTKKETEIYNLMIQGLNPQEIADKLIVQRCTIATHITHIFQKKECMVNSAAISTKDKRIRKHYTTNDSSLEEEND